MLDGETIGKYRLVSRLGQGGMGEVWLATASGYGGFTKTVVIKTLLEEHARDPLFIEMLAHEARTCARLNHPNLIEVFDFTEHGGIYLLAMEHVIGRSLYEIMRALKQRSWPVPAWFALRVIWECCRGLECAHDQGVIHCDLSPSNVMVTFSGITKILDFGVSHSLERGPRADRLKGKFSYIAPERIKSLATDCRTDIYSLGVMLYLLFTGQLPFAGASDRELLHNIVRTRPPRPSELAPIDSRIERMILRAMQPDPAARYQNIREVLAELSPCLEGQLGTYGQRDVANFIARLFPGQAPDDDDAITGESAAVQELPSFDIDVESSVREPTPPPETPPVRFARSSSTIKPLAVFTDVQESRTSVQNLFGERPSFAGAAAKLFERPAEPPVEPAKASWPWPRSRKSD